MEPGEFYDMSEAARILRISPSRVRALAAAGDQVRFVITRPGFARNGLQMPDVGLLFILPLQKAHRS